MGLELSILGIRKIKDEEIKELTGKTRKEMEKSKFFRKYFPKAPYDSWYWCYSQKEISEYGRYENVMHMFSPVKVPDTNAIYLPLVTGTKIKVVSSGKVR